MRKGKNLYKRKDGRWEARVFIGYGANGCPRYKYLYADTYRTALQKKQEYERGAVCRTPRLPMGEAISFRDMATLWLESSKVQWKLPTYVKYQDCLEKNILPYWGRLALWGMGQEDYDRLMSKLKKRLKASSLNTVNTVISGIVKFALSKRYLESEPFCRVCPSSKGAGRRIDILTGSETAEITHYISRNFTPITFGVLLALYEGIRLGELCALRWGDMDLAEGTLHIRKTLQRIRNPSLAPNAPKTILHLGIPKNGRERTIPLHPLLLDILKTHMKDRPSEHYVLRDGSPMEPRVYSYHFKRVLDQAGIRDVNFHTLRHTFASNCVEAGMDIKVLSEILGHSSVRITMDRYVHLSMKFKQTQMEVLEIPFFSK